MTALQISSPPKHGATRTLDERPISFQYGTTRLNGILHVPENPLSGPDRAGLVFLDAGIRCRFGPYRQYVKYARRFCREGYFVLRFDFPGIGASEGEFRDYSEYRTVIADNPEPTRRAIDALIEATGVNRVGLFGLCGGAYNAAKSAGVDPRVEAMILLSLPSAQLGNVTEDQMSPLWFRYYLTRVFRWQSWLKVLTLKANFGMIRVALKGLFQPRSLKVTPDDALWQDLHGFLKRDGRLLLFYGEQDPCWLWFKLSVGKCLTGLQAPESERYELHTIREAGHLFINACFQEEIMDRSVNWLEQLFGPSRRGS